MSLYVCQLLRPQRHCVLACFYEEGAKTAAEVVQGMGEKRAAEKINQWCGICDSRELRYEHARTKHAPLAEAMPELTDLQIANLLTAAMVQAKKDVGN